MFEMICDPLIIIESITSYLHFLLKDTYVSISDLQEILFTKFLSWFQERINDFESHF